MIHDLPERLNATDVFIDRHLREGRHRDLAIIDAGDDTSYSYGELADGVDRFAAALVHCLDARPEERALLLLQDSAAFACCFFGAIKVGVVPVPVSTLLKPSDYEVLCDDSRARILIVSAALLPSITPVLGGLRYLRHLVIVGPASLPENALLSVHDYAALCAKHAGSRVATFDARRDDACFWLYTSGTTGRPKAAIHLQHDMIVCAEAYARGVLDLRPEDRTYSVARLFFAYGLGNALYFPLYVGASTILHPDKPTPQRALELASKHRATVFFGVPTAYAAICALSEAERRAFDLQALRLAVSAGEALPPALYEKWRTRFGCELLDGIGSTEALHIFISNRPNDVLPGSSGKLVAGYRARVVDDANADVAPGVVGDLLIAGDSICAGYWNQQQRSQATFIGEWARTGDKYLCDAHGYYHYQGRSDDMLKAGGIWVSPTEVEAALAEHPAILECAVVGQADAHGLIKPKAFVVLRDDAPRPTAEDLEAFARKRLAAYKLPRSFETVAALPKTATGKIQRYLLRTSAVS
ncbi:MAG: benzoate-CoA ligase family protein [Deltaproteobacteria bacterium]|nr:benzoate-CoA ligase family protein [Deltaproteobacteria bacterium]